MNSLGIRHFNLHETLKSGQLFRYIDFGDHYLVHAGNRLFKIWREGVRICFEGVEEEFISRFFRLDEDMEQIYRQIGKDDFIRRAIDLYRGLRLTRQDPWECLISFLCSSAKNIPHIKLILEHLCRHFGKPVSLGNYRGYTFPCSDRISEGQDLGKIKAGFRTIYVLEVSRRAKSMNLGALAKLEYRDAKKELMILPGVGEKIADCVLLYSLDFTEAFPVDTWIRKAMRTGYHGGKALPDSAIREFAQNYFGRYAGYAQLYLYHFVRNEGLKRHRTGGRPRMMG
ncbi:MAG: DNA-3-methyladenine glycosylase family protein [Thermodesulfobacteriota bacterium]